MRNEILKLDTPWSLPRVIGHLLNATNILLNDKCYDGHGYEILQCARNAGQHWLNEYNSGQFNLDIHHNFETHRQVWRTAILKQISYCRNEKVYADELEPFIHYGMGPGQREADISFWAHELKAFDESYDNEGKPKYECVF